MPVLSSVLPDRYSFKATARCLDRIRFAAALAEKTEHLTDKMLSADDYAMVVTKKNAKLQGELNAALKTLKENGEYDKIWKKWFGEAK